jgi:hypothetical protein
MSDVTDATSTYDITREDVIDLRDLLELRDTLRGRTRCDNCGEATRASDGFLVHADSGEMHCDPDDDTMAEVSDPLDEDESALLAEIERFDAEEVNGDVDAAHSAEPGLIAESCFTDYAREFAEDIGLTDREGTLAPFVDWQRWADHIRQDYTEVTFAGATFLRRA